MARPVPRMGRPALPRSYEDCPQRARFLGLSRDEREAEKLARIKAAASDTAKAMRFVRALDTDGVVALLDAADRAFCAAQGNTLVPFSFRQFTDCFAVALKAGVLSVTVAGTVVATRPFDQQSRLSLAYQARRRKQKKLERLRAAAIAIGALPVNPKNGKAQGNSAKAAKAA